MSKKGKFIVLGFVVLIVGLLYIITGKEPAVEVEIGRREVCRYCNKVIWDSTETIEVPAWSASHYEDSLVVTQSICDSCSNVEAEVRYGKEYVCPRCGRVLKDETKTIRVPRKDAYKYQVKRIERNEVCSFCREKLIDELPYQLACINKGSLVPKDDPTIARFRYLLKRLEKNTANSLQEIADMTVKGQEILEDKYGVKVSLLYLMECANDATPSNSGLRYEEILTSCIVILGQ